METQFMSVTGNVPYKEDIKKSWGDTLARFDLGKVYHLSEILRNKSATKYYVYADDLDTRITEDRYGKPLTEVSVPEAIKALETAVASGEESFRIPLLIAALKALNTEWIDCFAVLHYGY